MKKTLFIIDAYNLIYRMFYAIPEMHTRDGRQVNAIFGVAKFLKGLAEENPHAHLVVATDVGKSFRETIYIDYKGTRDRMPDNLRTQIDGVFALFEAAGIEILSREGYEADDIIGSLATTCNTQEQQIVIISSDKDLCQFVQDGCVHIYDAMKRKFMKRIDVIEKFGVPPEQVRDYLAIVGDSSDNIPGISGFGPKKATDLLLKYKSLEALYISIGIEEKDGEFFIDSEKYEKSEMSEKMKNALLEQKENAFLSKKLATIISDLSVEYSSQNAFALGLHNEIYTNLLQSYEFHSLLPKEYLQEHSRINIAIHDIISLGELEKILGELQKENLSLNVGMDIDKKMLFSFSGKVYRIDPKNLDISAYVDMLLEHTRDIVGYDMKQLMKDLYYFKTPLMERGVENQKTLF